MNVQKEVVSCLWSEDLKQHIVETGFLFSQEDLLSVACQFAPDFAERLRLVELIAQHCPEVSEHAKKYIAWQQRCMKHFTDHDSGHVYELRILDDPSDRNCCEERYLCESYEAALEMIDGFYRCYDFAPEQPTVRYTIAKRCILRKGDPFREDNCGEAILGAGKVLIEVSDIPDQSEFGPCPEDCVDCPIRCIRNQDVEFPEFLPDRVAVQYRLPNGSIHYGIRLSLNWVGLGCDAYIIPLDSEMMNTRGFDAHWGNHWHEHVPRPNVRSVSPDSLPENLRENYHAFTAWLSTQPWSDASQNNLEKSKIRG